ncbi:hypothetical protein [Methylobacterium symbioticum]|uniref:Uncharacterized protein n=1 Tax=Methylobacterium symbioticum TaxID=2584084 RepID=A0A509EBJ2_9HYPH|nr:hypothetical protein [Methylobacterium symbioticum]VUD71571.1 hypothetical protein MET9862_02154 [Methylobacterium symbioticum]
MQGRARYGAETPSNSLGVIAARARSGAGITTPARRMVCAAARQAERSLAGAAASICVTFPADGFDVSGCVDEPLRSNPAAVAVDPAGAAASCDCPCGPAAPGPDAVIWPLCPELFCGVLSAAGFADVSPLFFADTAVARRAGVSLACVPAVD